MDFKRDEKAMPKFAAGLDHSNIKLRIVSYAGSMDFYAYANTKEFIGVRMNDGAIPTTPVQTARVSGWAYYQSEVQHEADGFIGNYLVHGAAAALDQAINEDIMNWWNGVRATFQNLKYSNYSAHPATLAKGKNKFDVSISNYSSDATCTFVIESVPPQGPAASIAIVQLWADQARKGYAQEFTFA